MKDLTKGKPSVLILSFALPVFLANLLQLTYSIVDTRIVGTFLGKICWQQLVLQLHLVI